MDLYLIIKSLHVISVISWMAGLLYLPRIFVYHSQNQEVKNISNVFKVMEYKLYFYIMTPAMALSWLLGIGLIHNIGFQKWLLWKFILVFVLTIYHLILGNFSIILRIMRIRFLPNFLDFLMKFPQYY